MPIPQVYEGLVKEEDIICTADYILYIAEKVYHALVDGGLPTDLAYAYAETWAAELDAHVNMRGFIARESKKLATKWQHSPPEFLRTAH
jgi:hypothetical protein